jgi:imidazolonepropionase-like amidohydrolase
MRSFLSWFWLCCIALGAGNKLPASEPLRAYLVETLWPGDGPPIQNAVVLVQAGKVLKVGAASTIEIPAEAIRQSYPGCSLIPGMVAVDTALATGSNEEVQNVTPDQRAIDAFDFYKEYPDWIASGITTAYISPGRRRLVSGQGAVVKLAGAKPTDRTLSSQQAMQVVLSAEALQPGTIYEPPIGAVSIERPVVPTRPQLGNSSLELINGFRLLLDSCQKSDGEVDSRLTALAEGVKNKTTFRIRAENKAEVQAALQISTQYHLNWILVQPSTIAPLMLDAGWNKEQLQGIVLRPEFRPGEIRERAANDDEEILPSWVIARNLVDHGFGNKITLQPNNDADYKDLLFLAKLYLRSGLTIEQVLKMLTANPARMMGLEGKVGSIREGADADFVLLSGEPLQDGSEILATYVNGNEVYKNAMPQNEMLFTAAKIYSANGLIDQGMVAVANGKIIGVGTDVTTSPNAARKSYPNAVIVPGYIDVGSQLGIGAPLANPVTLDTKLGNILARDDEAIQAARKGGLTTALFSSSQLPSPVVAFKLGDRPRVLKDPVAIRMEVRGTVGTAETSLKRMLGAAKTYHDAWTKYETELKEYEAKKKVYDEAKKKYDDAVKAAEAKKAEEEKKAEEAKKAAEANSSAGKPAAETGNTPTPSSGATIPQGQSPSEGQAPSQDKSTSGQSTDKKPVSSGATQEATDAAKTPEAELKVPEVPKEPTKPRAEPGLEPYRDLFSKKIVAMVEIRDDLLLEVAIRVIQEEFGIKMVVVGGEVAAKQPQLMAKYKVPVVVGPSLSKDTRGEVAHFPIQLSANTVPFLFQSSAGAESAGLANAISYSVYKGLGRNDALKALSSRAAEVFQLDSTGAIEVGKDADLVILSGSPFDLATEVLAVVIDGQIVYEKELP